MRCRYCGDVLPETVLGIQSHLRQRHGIRREVPPAVLRRPPAPPTITARRQPALGGRRTRVASRYRPGGPDAED